MSFGILILGKNNSKIKEQVYKYRAPGPIVQSIPFR